ncbi:pyridoxamine 5'-phosphate oxidase family protein [Geodermatophilus sp. SYSU D00804]
MTGTGTIRTSLDDGECRSLLGRGTHGHLAFTRDALPAIAPVRYALDGDRVVIPAAPDSDHLPPAGGAVVVLGVDGCDGDTEWSVTVVGPARTVTDAATAAALRARDWPRPLLVGDGHRFVLLTIGVLRGWRTTPPAAPVPGRAG